MTEHVHTHSRSSDVGIPGWLKTLRVIGGWVIGIFLAGIFTLVFLDSRYPSKPELSAVKETVASKLDGIEKSQQEMKEDLKDIKRALYRRPAN